jgi:hypothetical protein
MSWTDEDSVDLDTICRIPYVRANHDEKVYFDSETFVLNLRLLLFTGRCLVYNKRKSQIYALL